MQQNWQGFCQSVLNVEAKGVSRDTLRDALAQIDPDHLLAKEKRLLGFGFAAIDEPLLPFFDPFFENNPAFFDQAPEDAKKAMIHLMQLACIHDLAAVTPILRQHFVANVLQNAVLDKEWLAQLKHKLSALVQLDAAYKSACDTLRKKAAPYLQKLLSGEYFPYKDLQKRAESILKEDFAKLLLKETNRTDEIPMQQFSDAQLDAQIAKVAALVDIGLERIKRQRALEGFRIEFLKILQPLTYFKDLRAQQLSLRKELESVITMPQDIMRGEIEEVEKAYKAQSKAQSALLQRVPEIERGLKAACTMAELRMHDAKQTIKRRLFEVFSGICCYKDLTENLLEQKKALEKTLTELVDAFYAGKLTLHEFTSACAQMAYEHDVVKLRNEISHRSSRLKDLRDEAYQLFMNVQNRRRLLELIPGMTQEKIYRDLLLLMRRVRALILEIEDPFTAFKAALSKEEINYVFRAMWMKIEELLPQYEHLKADVENVVERQTRILMAAFFKTLDDLEESVKGVEGVRPALVSYYEREFSSGFTLDVLLKAIDAVTAKYPFSTPFLFFMQIKDFAVRQKMLLEAKELDEKIEGVRRFAKAMQYIKTYEEERVDTILEAFERQHLLEEEQTSDYAISQEWERYQKKMHYAISLVEEEVLLEIGLLDMHALMDVDPARLKKILRYALHTAKKESPTQPDTIDTLLENLSLACHELFDAKVLKASQKGNLVAQTLGYLIQLLALIADVQQWLETTRGKLRGAWGAPWVAEGHALRHKLERFEPGFSDTKGFVEPLVKLLVELTEALFLDIYKIAEIAERRGKGEDPLEIEKRHQVLLQKIALMQKEKGDSVPFVYLPGNIRFFSYDE